MTAIPESVRTAYDSVFGKLSPERARTVKIVCAMFSIGLECCLLEDGFVPTADNQVITETGAHAESYLAMWRHVRPILGNDEQSAIDALQRLSDWLAARNWTALPNYRNRDGRIVSVTAAGLHSQMNRHRERVSAFRRELADRKKNKIA